MRAFRFNERVDTRKIRFSDNFVIPRSLRGRKLQTVNHDTGG